MDDDQKHKEALEREEEMLSYKEISQEDSKDERIRETLIDLVKCNERSGYKLLNNVSTGSMIAWLEKQGEQINLPQFTFDDVLALQCVMETVKKVQEDKELYEQLQSLHNRLYDAYWLEKQGEQQPTDDKKLDVLKFIRKETCCGLAEANNALLKLIKVLKEHPSLIMDKPRKLKIEWEEQK